MKTYAECKLAEGFSLWKKLYVQLSFNIMGIIGVVGIALADWRWLLPYVVLYGYGIPGIVMRHLPCPRCPHLYTYGDCLQFPPTLAKRLVKQRKAHPLSKGEMGMFYFIFLLLPPYQLYWLRSQPMLLTIFVLAVAIWYLGQGVYFCKHCRVASCPFNRTQLVRY